VGSGAIKPKTFGEGTPQLAQAGQRLFAAVIAAYLELTGPGYIDLDLSPLLNPKASTTAAARGMARLFPDFATRTKAP
jgi:hypothetical protein